MISHSDLKGSWVGRYTNHGLFDGGCMKDQDLKRHVILNDHNRNSVISQLSKDTEFLASHNIMDYSLLLGIHYMKIATIDDDKSDFSEYENINNNHKSLQPHNINMNSVHNAPDEDVDEEKVKEESIPLSVPLRDECDANYNVYLGGLRAHIIEGPGIYYIGIIDFFQSYTWKKRLETWFRIHIQRLNGKGISCVDPKFYRMRFMKYMRNVMISEQKYKRKLKLNRKNAFTKEQVLIYPSSENINKNLNDIKRERSMRKDSFINCYNNKHRFRSHSYNAEDSNHSMTFTQNISGFKQLQAVMEKSAPTNNLITPQPNQLNDSIKTL